MLWPINIGNRSIEYIQWWPLKGFLEIVTFSFENVMSINLFMKKPSSHSLFKENLWGRWRMKKEAMKHLEEQYIEKKRE